MIERKIVSRNHHQDNSRVRRSQELPGLLPQFLSLSLLVLNDPQLLQLSHLPGLHLCQPPCLSFPPKASQHIKTGLVTGQVMVPLSHCTVLSTVY